MRSVLYKIEIIISLREGALKLRGHSCSFKATLGSNYDEIAELALFKGVAELSLHERGAS